MATSMPVRAVEARPGSARLASSSSSSIVRPIQRQLTPAPEKGSSLKADAPVAVDAQLPSLLREAESLAQSFDNLQSGATSSRKERAQARAAKRAKRKGTEAKSSPPEHPPSCSKDLPVFTSSRSRGRQQRGETGPRPSRTARQSATSGSSTSAAASLSSKRIQRSRAWGRVDSANGNDEIAHITPSGKGGLTIKEEVELTKYLQKYYKLQDQFDEYSKNCERTPSITEFAEHLGKKDIGEINTILKNGPVKKAEMIRLNMGLVYTICEKYQHDDVPREELRSAAVEGLVRATKMFDPEKGFKFSTYAHWWIRQAVTKTVSVQSRVMYIPQNVYEVASRMTTAQQELAPEYGSVANIPAEVLAKSLGISKKRLQDVQSAMRSPVSLNAPLSCDGDSTVQDTIEDESAVRSDDLLISESIEDSVNEYLKQLPSRDACIVRMRYGLDGFERPHTLEEIGFRFAVTRERIRQIESKALSYLKRSTLKTEMSDFIAEQDVEVARASSAVGRKSS